MEISTLNKIKIQQVYTAYQNEYDLHLPTISKFKPLHKNNAWAQFSSLSLYNKEYILFVDNDLLSENNKFIKQVLYHEFTHLADSLKFLHLQKHSFSTIMTSYSEFHASKREMRKALSLSDTPISLNTFIYRTKEITIKTFMQQAYEGLLFDFNKMENNCGLKDFYYDTNRLYYYLGYISAVKEFNLDIPFNILKFPVIFQTITSKIYNIIDEENINLENLCRSQNELEEEIKKNAAVNQILKDTTK